MRFLIDAWRRIGTRLYIALGFAVFLTLVSSMVGVYYFERSGDLNFKVRTESVPVLESAWSAAREGERIRSLGLVLLGDPATASVESSAEARRGRTGAAGDGVSCVELSAGTVPALSEDAQGVYDAAVPILTWQNWSTI